MQAVTWQGKRDVSVDEVPDPEVEQPTDAVIEVSKTAICGSDLHLYNGFAPAMEEGDIIGHEAVGHVVDTGARVDGLEEGDRVVVPFTISCGECWFCKNDLFSLCDNSNPNAEMAREEMGHSPAGIFGYSHMLGGFDGAQAEYMRVPYADVGPTKIEADVTDEQALMLADVFPTGYQAAENADIEEGDTVAVWGCGPVGQFAIQSAWMQGANRVIAIDRVPERLAMARKEGEAEAVDFSQVDVYDELMDMTNERGPDRCIDAVGTEAHIEGLMGAADRVKQSVGLEDDRPAVLRQALRCCRKGGTISVPGVYLGSIDNLPFGAAMNKSLTIKTGQTHVQRYLDPLMEKVVHGEIDPSFVVTHRAPLKDAPGLYQAFNDKADGTIKVVLEP